MTRNSDRRHESLMRSAITGAAFAALLGVGVPASAEEGGDPAHRISIFERIEAAETMPSKADADVIPAAAQKDDERRFHDKTEAEWRAYHDAQSALYRKNFGR